jgi:hypothetical protein
MSSVVAVVVVTLVFPRSRLEGVCELPPVVRLRVKEGVIEKIPHLEGECAAFGWVYQKRLSRRWSLDSSMRGCSTNIGRHRTRRSKRTRRIYN